ncbi:CDK-activating kinase assembly factor MAT1-domain-containing protein [Halteromyces radiatus]|uniref:CDK-activating kinase assembly factor MAT1-domain-containing protein n=1 Tax=Halteromyces radiatus TaxID=101107 RepID=UPI00221E922A|nr:CDK-activating kinase assembly factor MAT1-domain-containing protein [Halteromyces radiatus]KAI8099363.1 CDK-activating kinase assembly factor MAT1-domain-containing protein [Halteromyces radiatus]
MNDVDVAETEARINAYEVENKDSIAANQARSVNENRFQSYQEELEKQEKEHRREEYMQQLENERRQKEQEKSDLIKELASTNKSAQAIMATRQSAALKRSSALRQQTDSPQNISSPRLAMPTWITSAMETDSDARYTEAQNFDPFDLQYRYPSGFTLRTDYTDPSTDYLVNNKMARAGGYSARFAHQRALNDAFTGLACLTVQDH